MVRIGGGASGGGNLGRLLVKIGADTRNFNKGIEGVIQKTKQAEGRAGGATKRMSIGFRSMAIAAAAAATAVAGVTAAVAALGKRGGQVINLQRAFGRVTGDLSGSIKQLRTRTRGLISDYDLLRQANTAIALGSAKNVDEFADLSEGAIALGRALGLDAQFALNSLNIGIARQSRLVLDNVGVIVSASEAQKKYARSLGIATSELTDAEKKEAFRVEALRQVAQKTDELGGITETGADAITRFESATRNLIDAFATMVANSPAVVAFFGTLAEKIQQIADNLPALVAAFKIGFGRATGLGGRTAPGAPLPDDLFPEGLPGSPAALARAAQARRERLLRQLGTIQPNVPRADFTQLQLAEARARIRRSALEGGRPSEKLGPLFTEGLILVEPQMVAVAAKELGEDLKKGLSDMEKQVARLATNIGTQIIFGLIDGINDFESLLKQVLKGVVSIIIGQLTGGLGILSPSTVMQGLGRQTALGFAMGMQSELGTISNAAAGMGSVALESAPVNFSMSVDTSGLSQPMSPHAAALQSEAIQLFIETARNAKEMGFRLD